MTANALTAAQPVIVPVSTELMAERAVKLILERVDDIKESELNPDLHIWRIVPTMFDQCLAHHREILEALRAKYGAQLSVAPLDSATDEQKHREIVKPLDGEGGPAGASIEMISCATSLMRRC